MRVAASRAASSQVLCEETFYAHPGILGICRIRLGACDAQQRAKNWATALLRVHERMTLIWVELYIVLDALRAQ